MRYSPYEELGLRPDASADEIRRVQRRLARLFHPDRFQDDPDLQRLAEAQLKRLNMLCDALARRVQTDAGQHGDQQEPCRLIGARDLVTGWRARTRTWLARNWRAGACAGIAGMIGFAVLVWYWGQRQQLPILRAGAGRTSEVMEEVAAPGAPQARRTTWEPPRAQPAGASPELVRLQREHQRALEALRQLGQQLQQVEAERSAAVARLAALSASLERKNALGFLIDPPGRPSPPEPPRGTSAPSAQVGLAVSPSDPSRGLVGLWVWVPQGQVSGLPGSYPPEYIEVVVRIEDGQLHGAYRARYVVPDRTLSPLVNFEFGGELNPEHRYPWWGSGGAKGTLRMGLLETGRLWLEWYAERLSPQLGLVSGKAVLVRVE